MVQGKIKYLTVKGYAKLWEKSESAIYRRISEGKMLAVPEPDGGKGQLIPVCSCPDNLFSGMSLCISHKKEIESPKGQN